MSIDTTELVYDIDLSQIGPIEYPSKRSRHVLYTDYLVSAFDNRQLIIDKAVAYLSDLDFDTIAVTGVSGLLGGPEVALRMKKDLIVVRKGEKSHSLHDVEGRCGSRVLMFDDEIDTGSTYYRVQKAVTDLWNTEMIGAFFYKEWDHRSLDHGSFWPPERIRSHCS